VCPGDGPRLPLDREFLQEADAAGRIWVVIDDDEFPAHPVFQEVSALGGTRSDFGIPKGSHGIGHRLSRRLIAGGIRVRGRKPGRAAT
jgi:hypothetical protein